MSSSAMKTLSYSPIALIHCAQLFQIVDLARLFASVRTAFSGLRQRTSLSLQKAPEKLPKWVTFITLSLS